MNTKRLEWISTPSHGYLKVLRMDLNGFNPSTYSRSNASFYYLEEDCDAGEYLAHVFGESWYLDDTHSDIVSTITDDHIDVFKINDSAIPF